MRPFESRAKSSVQSSRLNSQQLVVNKRVDERGNKSLQRYETSSSKTKVNTPTAAAAAALRRKEKDVKTRRDTIIIVSLFRLAT